VIATRFLTLGSQRLAEPAAGGLSALGLEQPFVGQPRLSIPDTIRKTPAPTIRAASVIA
jgi:hypothetical protein